jgi:formiminotetrahydrofolate cyclodeaminase
MNHLKGSVAMKNREAYSEANTFVFENAVVKVYIPDLTEFEKKIRERELHKASEEILKSYIKRN